MLICVRVDGRLEKDYNLPLEVVVIMRQDDAIKLLRLSLNDELQCPGSANLNCNGFPCYCKNVILVVDNDAFVDQPFGKQLRLQSNILGKWFLKLFSEHTISQ